MSCYGHESVLKVSIYIGTAKCKQLKAKLKTLIIIINLC